MWGTTQPDPGAGAAQVTAIDLRPAVGGGVTVLVTTRGPDGDTAVDTADCRGRCPRDVARGLADVHDLVPVWPDDSWVAGSTPRPPVSHYERRV